MQQDAKGKLFFCFDQKKYNLNFQRYYLSNQIERIKVYGKKSELLLQSDRPEIKNNNKRKSTNWKIISTLNPEIFNNSIFINILLHYLEDELNRIDFPKQPFTHPKNRP